MLKRPGPEIPQWQERAYNRIGLWMLGGVAVGLLAGGALELLYLHGGGTWDLGDFMKHEAIGGAVGGVIFGLGRASREFPGNV